MSILSSQRARRRFSAAAALALVAGLAPAVVAPQPAAAASPTTATLIVNKGGDRTGEQTVGPLAGATFAFYAGTSGAPPSPLPAPDATCTTDATGSCSVDVPGRTGTNQGYWIIEQSAPTGWRIIPSLVTGNGGSAPFQSTPYNQVFTGAVANNQTYTFPVPTTGNTNRTARGPQWADERDNPPLPGACGLHIALVIDVSGSISSSLQTVKNAANGFVDALTGTPSEIALYTFATNATAVLNPTPVSDQAGADSVKAAINSLTAGGNTNWDQGIWQVAAAPFDYDAAIVLTDGNPTVYGPPPAQGPGGFTRFQEVEQGVFSANALKARGTKIIAVGVGAGVSGAPDNLIAISGPVANDDYYQTGFAELEALFRRLALENCAGTISVVKKVIPPGGTPADALPAGGWTISTTTSGVTPPSGVTDTSTGAVNFAVDLGGETSRPVTLDETVQAGFTPVQQGGQNATCTANGNPATVTNGTGTAFTVDALANGIVSCVILNQAADPVASVVVNKTWVINGQTFQDPDQAPEFQAALLLPGIDQPAWGVEYHDYQAGQTIVVDEQINTTLLPPGCTNTASGDLGQQTLDAGLNTFQITNTVTCVTRLQLVKAVDNPYGGTTPPPTAWTLNAYPPGSPTPVISGTTGVQDTVTPDLVYSLGESNVPGFAQTVEQGAVIVPPATGSWNCLLAQPDGPPKGPGPTGADGTVAVQIGQTAICTATNVAQAAKLTLVKQVENPYGGTATPQDWVLSATPRSQVQIPTITGRSGEPAVTGAQLYPNTPYDLAESGGPQGYEQVGAVRCVLTGTETVVPTPDNVLTASFAQDITCTFTNRQLQPPPGTAKLTLVKQVENKFGGTAKPTDWLLSATPPPGSSAAVISGRSGEAAVTDAAAVAGVGYTLAESGGPAGYEQIGEVRCVYNDTGDVVPTPGNVLTPVADRSYTCTWRNGQLDPGGAYLTLVKKLVDGGKDGWGGGDGGWGGSDGGGSGDWGGGGGQAKPTDWLLTAAPVNGATPISGRTGSPAVTDVRVQVGVGYRLSESGGPQGYEQVGPPSCVLTGSEQSVPVVNGVVTPQRGQDITCTFTNRAAKKPGPPPHPPWHHGKLPVTGLKLTGIVGGGLLAVAAGAVLLLVTWRRRRSLTL
ncbi:VWA domain-containing protein [Micromonospora auratinigra]|uniref:von Willebrand factor type A domain-containing protein n=1 Tax=Micromonospora auratinigra TaxID=261654 RepID=A0A1A8ZW49_9ACTN|nr:VWA domain-containing protein [Micromonospora auratinigra]SBT48115.1 von Willebrand factor type A domain-containing protein [Micromonospora auratinigra]